MGVQRGDLVEKYFKQKLKFLLKPDNAFSNYIDLYEVHNDFILNIKYVLLKEPKDSNINKETVLNIIVKIDKALKDQTSIQINSTRS